MKADSAISACFFLCRKDKYSLWFCSFGAYIINKCNGVSQQLESHIKKVTLNNKKSEGRYLYQCSGPDITWYNNSALLPEGNNSNWTGSEVSQGPCCLCSFFFFYKKQDIKLHISTHFSNTLWIVSRMFSLTPVPFILPLLQRYCIDFLKIEVLLSAKQFSPGTISSGRSI